jgi:hypothetical protein
MFDEWSKKLPDGRTVVYTRNIVEGNGGTITAKVGDVTQTTYVNSPMTREQVEADFGNSYSPPNRSEES